MKPLPISFEPTASFCYKFARYHLLPEIALEPEALSGEPFRLVNVASRIISRYLTDDQLEMTYISRDAGKPREVGAALKFFATLRAERAAGLPT